MNEVYIARLIIGIEYRIIKSMVFKHNVIGNTIGPTGMDSFQMKFLFNIDHDDTIW